MKTQMTSTKLQTNSKHEALNSKQPLYDLEERTLQFAKDVRDFVRQINKDIANLEDSKQLIRSSGSIGANYIEANESLSKKDFAMRVKISRKEAKETAYWLQLLVCSDELNDTRINLLKESIELNKILSAILRSSES